MLLFSIIRLKKVKLRYDKIVERKCSILTEKFSIDEKLSKLDKLMENEQNYQVNLNNRYKKLSENLFQLNDQLISMRKNEKKNEMNNQASRNQLYNIKKQIKQLDQQLVKQQEFIYYQDFIKQTIDRRLNRILREKANEKYSEYDLQVHELQSEYDKKNYQYNQLQNQITILYEELRIIKRDCNQFNLEKTDFNEKLLQFDLYINQSEKLVKKLNNDKEVKYSTFYH